MSAARVAALDREPPTRGGGCRRCGVGRTRFAADLTSALRSAGESVESLDSDLVHQPRRIRHRDPDPARGHLADAHDLTGLRSQVLEPLGHGPAPVPVGLRRLADDAPVTERVRVPADAVVVFGATVVQRPDLRPPWDMVLLIEATDDVALERATRRDSDVLGGAGAALQAHRTRYDAAWRRYEAPVGPTAAAGAVIAYDDPELPRRRP